MDIRSFFKKPGEAKLGALPAALPSAGALSPVPAAAGGRKRLTVDEPRELIDLTEAGKAEPADKRARKDAPLAAGKRSLTPEPAVAPPPKKAASAKKALAASAKKQYPRPLLREESELEFTVLASGTAWNGERQAAQVQPLLSLGGLPRGPDDCLEGLTFVLTGNLKHLARSDAEDFVKRHGGRITQAVSSKTSFLLVGADSGSSKYEKAKELKTPLLDENETAAPPLPEKPVPMPQLPSSGAPGGPAVRAAPSAADQLWVERHKPTSVAQLIGNGKLIADLRIWLGQWHRMQTEFAGAKAKDAPKKAVLISGPPGIGKTSSAKIICAALGFEVMEVNASDARGKSEKDVKSGLNGKCSNIVKEMVTNSSVNFDGQPKRQVLIMDEVDGMSGGDRGGVMDLIQSIKTSKVPIICICNDAWSQKLRSLKNHCLELVYSRPTKLQIRSRMVGIAAKEGLQVSDNAMEALIENCHSDIRLILNTLQMRRLNSVSLSFDDIKGSMTKDLELGSFNIVDKLFQPERNLSINERIKLAFQDADIIPLFIQENYLNIRPNSASSELRRLDLVADASWSISEGDVLNTCVRRHQRWTLMPYSMVLMCLQPASIVSGRREALNIFPGERNFHRFPSWLGKNSSAGKQRRLLGELHSHAQVSGSCSANRSSVREEYMPAMRLALTAPMWSVANGGSEKEGILRVMELMNDYCLTKDDYTAILDMTRIKAEGVLPALKDPESLIPTAVKSAFTRACNDKCRATKSGILLPEFKRGRKKASKGPVDGDEEEELDEDEQIASESEDDEPDKARALAAKLAKRGLNVTTKAGAYVEGKAKAKAKAAPAAAKKASKKK